MNKQTFSASLNREKLIQKMQATHFDLLVIGGGITGCGIALDAASRGLKVGLVEKDDFASGTSSRSTKLIHGGLRYLKQFEIALVREVGRERAIVHNLAPHLVVNEKMLLPIVEGGTFGKILTSIGLMVYDVLAGVEREDQRLMFSRERTIQEEKLLEMDILRGSGFYAEYRTDDARLTIEVMKTASEYGAIGANYVEVKDFQYDESGRVEGLVCTDTLSGDPISLKANYIVNAAGPWVDTLRKKDNSLNAKHLYLTKGVHLVVPHEKLPLKHAVYFDVPDGRMIFAIPRQKVTYIGTTDTPYHDDLDHVITELEDAQYLVDAVNNFFPSITLSIEDVVSSWAGLRPLIHEEGKSASEISRKDEIFLSSKGLISIAGGKLTGYRKMAERIMDVVGKEMKIREGKKLPEGKTKGIVLMGGAYEDAKAVEIHAATIAQELLPFGMGKAEADYLVANYGKQTDLILEHFFQEESTSPLNLLRAELWFALNYEMVHTALDFFNRRTGRLYFDIDSILTCKEPILQEMAEILNWTQERLQQEVAALDQALHEASHFPKKVREA
jgi:glycerol-3-phosphate dehydrogenase